MTDLTNTQRKAVETVDRNVCVSAGAGTGKTRVLVERFLYLIECELARSHEILAITFTEKAAQEMKARIARRLREQGLERARRELENAYIGTIHSFCARILREHPIEAGVDPSFRVLEEDEAHILQESVLDQLIEARFQESAVFDLLRIYSEEGIREAIKQIANRIHTFGKSISEISTRQHGGSATIFGGTLVLSKAKSQDGIIKKILEALKPLKALKGKEEDCILVEETLQEPVSNWNEIETLKEIGKRFRKQGKAKVEIETFRNVWDDFISANVEMFGQNVRDTFLNLASDFETRYRAIKEERSSLDFNDLERRAVNLLSGNEPTSEACRNIYRKNFKYVMVDEFQDTAPLQDKLITLVSRPNNLFVVGDWRQSIYGFRGADPSLFLEKEEMCSKPDAGEQIRLTENFRSRSELLNQINPFFEKLWVEEKKSFEALKAYRTFPVKTNPSVEFLTIEREENESIEEARMKEARILAERIHDLVTSGAYEYRDFAMLFRVATDIYYYEHALKNLAIPYYVVSGRGFYHQPEIRDLISFLELLENPHLDIPLAAVLRSPLVQVSDDALFWLSNASKQLNPNTPLYHAFLKCHEISEIQEKDQMRLQSFRTFFFELLAQKEKWAVSECLELILENTEYDRYVLGSPHGKRHFANLRKLVEIARELETREPLHLGDFIRYVKGLETQEVRESEAQVEALEGNVVKLMTIHKAKGLEFKAVLIPDLNREGEKRTSRFLLDLEYGLAFKVFNEATRDFEETFSYRKIKEKMIRNTREESKRLLYVGMTRARDHLILSGASKEEENSKQENKTGEENDFDGKANWYEWIDQWSISGAGFERHAVQTSERKAGRIPSPLAEHQKIKTALEAGKSIPIKTPEGVDQMIESLKPITPVHFERIDLPVSAFSVFEHDPDEYRRVYELGVLPEETDTKLEEWKSEEDETEISAADFGTVIHKIFEHLVSIPKKADERLPNLVHRFAGNLEPNTREEIFKLSNQFLKSKTFSEIKQAKARHAEIPFVFRLKGGIIQGTLDLLYQTQDDMWVILDYKTSEVDLNHLEEAAGRYRSQLMLYALACHELLKISVKRASLYFVRVDQTFYFSLEAIDFTKLRSDFEAIQKEIITQQKAWTQR